jgi:hypothetical protein
VFPHRVWEKVGCKWFGNIVVNIVNIPAAKLRFITAISFQPAVSTTIKHSALSVVLRLS